MYHCVKSVQIRRFFCSVFSRIRTEYGEILRILSLRYLSVFSPNAGKYGPEKTPYLNNFHAVKGTSVLKYAERKCVGRTGWLQILKSEKCTLPLKEWMAASIL